MRDYPGGDKRLNSLHPSRSVDMEKMCTRGDGWRRGWAGDQPQRASSLLAPGRSGERSWVSLLPPLRNLA